MDFKEQKLKEFSEKFIQLMSYNGEKGTWVTKDVIDFIDKALEEQVDEIDYLEKGIKEWQNEYQGQEKRLRLSKERFEEATIDLVDKHFPKGECQERGSALVLYAEILITICQLQENKNV